MGVTIPPSLRGMVSRAAKAEASSARPRTRAPIAGEPPGVDGVCALEGDCERAAPCVLASLGEEGRDAGPDDDTDASLCSAYFHAVGDSPSGTSEAGNRKGFGGVNTAQ